MSDTDFLKALLGLCGVASTALLGIIAALQKGKDAREKLRLKAEEMRVKKDEERDDAIRQFYMDAKVELEKAKGTIAELMDKIIALERENNRLLSENSGLLRQITERDEQHQRELEKLQNKLQELSRAAGIPAAGIPAAGAD